LKSNNDRLTNQGANLNWDKQRYHINVQIWTQVNQGQFWWVNYIQDDNYLDPPYKQLHVGCLSDQ
jgi:hypothetical protein